MRLLFGWAPIRSVTVDALLSYFVLQTCFKAVPLIKAYRARIIYCVDRQEANGDTVVERQAFNNLDQLRPKSGRLHIAAHCKLGYFDGRKIIDGAFEWQAKFKQLRIAKWQSIGRQTEVSSRCAIGSREGDNGFRQAVVGIVMCALRQKYVEFVLAALKVSQDVFVEFVDPS
jgi:hypothetical protein